MTHDGNASGTVRSGTVSPVLGIGIGTCYLPTADAVPGTTIEIDVRAKPATATIVRTPFYTKGSHK